MAGMIRGCRRSAVFVDVAFTPESLRLFCEKIGVARFNSTIDVTILENSIREHLNAVAPRYMAVLEPLKVVLTTIRKMW